MLTLYVPLFDVEIIRFRGNPVVAGSSPCINQQLFRAPTKPEATKGPLSLFWLCETFFSKIFQFLQRVPLKLLIICKKIDLKNPNDPFYSFRHCEIFQKDLFRLEKFFVFSQWPSKVIRTFADVISEKNCVLQTRKRKFEIIALSYPK